MVGALTKLRIRSTCDGQVTQESHRAVQVCHQVSHVTKRHFFLSFIIVFSPPKNWKNCATLVFVSIDWLCLLLLASPCIVWSTDPNCMSLSSPVHITFVPTNFYCRDANRFFFFLSLQLLKSNRLFDCHQISFLFFSLFCIFYTFRIWMFRWMYRVGYLSSSPI